MGTDRQGTPDGPADGPGGGNPDRGSEPILITVQQIVDYVECPLRFAFLHIYQIADQRTLTAFEAWARTIGRVYVDIHFRLSEERSITWAWILNHWEKQWAGECRKHGIGMGEAHLYRNRGCRTLLQVFEAIHPDMEVLPLYPASRDVNGFHIHAKVPVIRIVETRGKGRSGRRVEIISIDAEASRMPTDFEACRRMDYLVHKYGLELEVRHRFRKIAKDVVQMVYLPRIGRLASIKVDEKHLRQALRWVGYVLDSIKRGFFYPRTGDRCGGCAFREVCDVGYVSYRALERPAQTRQTIEGDLCKPGSKPTSM